MTSDMLREYTLTLPSRSATSQATQPARPLNQPRPGTLQPAMPSSTVSVSVFNQLKPLPASLLRLPPSSLLAPSSTSLRRFSTTHLSSYSHSNPLGIPPNRFPVSSSQQGGIPPKNSPPKLNISRSIPKKRPIPHVKKVLVVASGKGGVGKSTVAVNLAISISKNSLGLRVGLLDLDVFGPSVPKLMGLDRGGLFPELTKEHALVPLRNHGISCMSVGFIVGSSPGSDGMIAWRGMMVMKAVQQLLFDVDWRAGGSVMEGEAGLDLLVVDMPPGTGDVAMSLGQLVEIDGAVIVSTPQDIALVDVAKGVSMFQKLEIPIIGAVLNMSTFVCPSCKTPHALFGPSTNFSKLAHAKGIAVLGEVPLEIALSQAGDSGKPVAAIDDRPDSCFTEIGQKAMRSLGL